MSEPNAVLGTPLSEHTLANRGASTQPRGHRNPPLALAAFAIPLGLAGLGGGWSAATVSLGAPSWPSDLLYGSSAAVWLTLTGIYLWQVLRDGRSVIADLEHPASGPFTAFVPLVGILLSAHYSQYSLAAERWACVFFVLSLMILAARLFAHWVTAGETIQTLHPGYFVPMVAGAFVASIGFSAVHAHHEALAAFGAGAFFWLVMTAVVTTRLMTAGPPSAMVVPGLSAFLVAAGTANVAWIVSHPGPMGEMQYLLTGVLVMMVVIQLALFEAYRKLSFSMAFWIFTFPVAVTANYGVRWFAASGLSHWQVGAWIGLALASAFVAATGLRTIATIPTTAHLGRSRADRNANRALP
jgi:tellurite resistance protein